MNTSEKSVTPEHLIEAYPDHFGTWNLGCDCGWTSGWAPNEEVASLYAEEHLNETTDHDHV
jgi:hypothetical protein